MSLTQITEQKAVELTEDWLRKNDRADLKANGAVFAPAKSKANPNELDLWLVFVDLRIPVDPGHMIFEVDAQTGNVEPMSFP